MSASLARNLRDILQIGQRMGFSEASWEDIGVTQPLRRAAVSGDLQGWTSTLAARAARLVGFDDVDLWGPDPIPPSAARHFDGGARVVPAADQAVVQAAVSLARAVSRLAPLASEVGRPTRQLPRGTKPVYEQAYHIANSLRRKAGISHKPIPSLVRFVEDEVGIPVVPAPLAKEHLGMAAAASSAVVVVLADRLWHTPALLRRTLAHELCHALHDPLAEDGTFAVTDWAEGDGDADPERVEQRARAFSAELLMPLGGMRTLLPSAPLETPAEVRRAILAVSGGFGAPPGMAQLHMVNRGLLDPRWKEAVFDIQQPDIEPEPEPTLLRRALHRAVQKDDISSGRARELLSLVPATALG